MLAYWPHPYLKAIDPQEEHIWLAQSYFCKTVRRRKMWRKLGIIQKHMSHEIPSRFSSNLLCRVAYVEDIKYVNLIEISPVVIEIWGVENGKVAVLINNTLLRHTAFLAADTQPCLDMTVWAKTLHVHTQTKIHFIASAYSYTKELYMHVHCLHWLLSTDLLFQRIVRASYDRLDYWYLQNLLITRCNIIK